MEAFAKYLITVDKDMNVVSAAEEFLEYIGRETVNNLDQVVPPQDMMQLRNAVFAIDPGALGLTCFRIRTSEGRLNWIACNVEKDETRSGVLLMELSDIQTLKSEGALSHYDEMTGLLSKQSIIDFAVALTQSYPRKKFYFCLLDIDHFKNVNDSFGHQCGDEVITDVAHIIRDCVGQEGMVGRIGGDEFMIVLEKVDTVPRVREVLARIRETVEEKYANYKDSLNITVSIGAGLYPDYASGYDELFRLADNMLYRAKTKGRNRYIIYTPEIHGDVLRGEEKVTTVTSHAAESAEKQRLILDLMKNFLQQMELSLQSVLERMLAAYNMDEVYIFYDRSRECRYGIERKKGGDGQFRLENVRLEMPILASEVFRRHLNGNNAAIINLFDLNRERDAELIEFLTETDRRYLVAYYMADAADAKKKGYVVFANRADSPCRLSETDIAELIYFGRMVELTSSYR